MNGDDLREAKRNRLIAWMPLWVCAALILFGNLGIQGITGSEARWTQIAREMIAHHDYLHPTINFQPYFDKPLLTYWFIVVSALFQKGVVSELAARIPSALAAFGALLSLVALVRKLWSPKLALTAGWIFLTTYSFAFWGRLAEADMANLAFCIAAAAWFVYFRDRAYFFAYTVFFLICAAGAHAKGLGAFAVPVLVVLADLIAAKNWKLHLNWKLAAAALIGAGVYLIPFGLAEAFPPAVPPVVQNVIDSDGTLKTSGFALVIRENIIRFFAPFDHNDEGFYAYFIHVPRLMLPWSPILVLALIALLKRWRTLDRSEKWLLLSTGFIFLFFTLSGSRRHYYILPVVPYCVILCSIYLESEEMASWLLKLRSFFLVLYRYVPLALAVLGTVGLLILRIFPSLIPAKFAPLQVMVPQTLLAALAAAVAIPVCLQWLSRLPGMWNLKNIDFRVLSSIVPVYILMVFVFVYMLPASESFRGEKRTALAMSKFIKSAGINPVEVFFFERENINAVYYLNLPNPIGVLTRENVLEKMKKGDSFLLISQERFLENLHDVSPRLPRMMKQHRFPWEKSNPKKSKALEMRCHFPAGGR